MTFGPIVAFGGFVASDDSDQEDEDLDDAEKQRHMDSQCDCGQTTSD